MNKILFSSIMLSAVALTACSDDTYSPDPEKNWAGTTEFFSPVEEDGFSTYYKPAIGRCGDPMPFYDEKSEEFKVYYLQEYDNNGASYHPILSVATKDCANYVNEGLVLPAGTPTEQDAGVGTGCRVYDKENDVYYIYYTGHNANCAQTEAVMRATSTDGKNFTKDLAWSLKGKQVGLSETDFRDPQVFKGDDGKWHMIISSSGKFADYTSANLKDWTFNRTVKMVWDRTSECPDVFQMGDWWYLVFSDQSKWGRCVKYIMGTSLADLYDNVEASRFPNADEGKLDNRGFFAGKTASNGTDRYIWGWCPIRYGSDIWAKNLEAKDDVEPAWSGALVCHKLIQHEDGTITLGEVPGIKAKYNKEVALDAVECAEGATFENGNAQLTGDSFIRFGRLGYHNHISFTVKVDNADDKFGVSFVRSNDNKRYASVNFNNPHWEAEKRNLCRLEFLQVNGNGDGQDFVNGALSNFVPRPADNTYNIDIYTDNSVVVVYYNNVMAYTTRIYGIQKNGWSINNYGGKITVSDLKVTQY
ncbi:MAG: DUF4975 domain-containing protein [Bacteroidales bacterium]|nr:DUF4975 domain-containing protein [Candidatus Minthousia equi]